MRGLYRTLATISAVAALASMTGLVAQAQGHSLAYAGGLFSYASGKLTANNTVVSLTYNGAAVSGTYYLTFSGSDANLNSSSSTMTNISWSISQNSNGSSPVLTATSSKGLVSNTGSGSVGVLGSYLYTGGIPGLSIAPNGSYGLTLSGWNGSHTSPSGGSGTFTPATPEASTSMSMAGLLLGGALLGVRKRRKVRA